MPTDLTGINGNAEIEYRLRELHRDTGELLWSWDTLSKTAGLCERQEIATQTINATEKLIACIQGPPATVFTLAVQRLAFNNTAIPAPLPVGLVDFQLVAGHGRAATLLLHTQWTPNGYLSGGDQAWIFQETRRLCSTWWLFASTQDGQGGPGRELQIDIRMLLSRGTPANMVPPQLGPNVVVIP